MKKKIIILTLIGLLIISGCSSNDDIEKNDTNSETQSTTSSYENSSEDNYSDSYSSNYSSNDYGYDDPREGESFSEYVQRVDPDLYDTMEENLYNSME